MDGISGLSPQDFIMDKLSSALADSKTLEHLDISGTRISNWHKMLNGLAKNRSLKTLIMKNCKLNFQDLKYVTDAIRLNPNLRIVKVGNNSFSVTQIDELAKVLATNETLNELDIDNNDYNNNFLEALKTNKGLRQIRLKISIAQIGKLVEVLRENTTLKVVDILNARLDEDSIQKIKEIKHIHIYYHDDRV